MICLIKFTKRNISLNDYIVLCIFNVKILYYLLYTQRRKKEKNYEKNLGLNFE